MKKMLAAMLLAAVVHTANAATYVYDSNVQDWYGTDGWTHIVSDPGGASPLFRYDSAGSITAFNNYGVLTFDNGYVGAVWNAPAGEAITQIAFTFSGVVGTNSAPNLTVYAGENAADTFQGAYALSAAWATSSESLSFLESQNYGSVAIRNWDYQNQICGFYDGWHSNVSTVTITTAAVPEPATCMILLGSAAIGLIRRKR